MTGMSVSLQDKNQKPNNFCQIGTHGIVINFEDGNGRRYNGTYLPEVAPAQGCVVKQFF